MKLGGVRFVIFSCVALSFTCGCSNGSNEAEKGIAAARADDWDLALSCFNAALKSDPKNAEWLARRGGIYICLNKKDEAIADCSEAIRADDHCIRAYCNRALAYQAKGDPEAALNDCKKAVQIAEATHVSLSLAHYVSGAIYLSLDEVSAALADAQAAVKAEPSDKGNQKLVVEVQERKAQLVKKLSELKMKRRNAVDELARLRGDRNGPQTDEEFQADEEKARAADKVALEAAKNDYLKAYENYQKLERDTAVNGGGAQERMKVIEEKGKLDQAEIHLHELQRGRPLDRQQRSLNHRMELAQEKLVDALTRQIDAISQQLRSTEPEK